jgi:hypothetical protein
MNIPSFVRLFHSPVNLVRVPELRYLCVFITNQKPVLQSVQ